MLTKEIVVFPSTGLLLPTSDFVPCAQVYLNVNALL